MRTKKSDGSPKPLNTKKKLLNALKRPLGMLRVWNCSVVSNLGVRLSFFSNFVNKLIGGKYAGRKIENKTAGR